MTNALRMTWLFDRSQCPRDLAAQFLQVTGQLLPEAMPAKLGDGDPPAGAFSTRRFKALWESGTGGWTVGRPFGYGRVSNLAALGEPSTKLHHLSLEPSIIGSISISVDAAFVAEPANEVRLCSYFLALAEAGNSFLSVIGIERGAEWRRSSMSAGRLSNPPLVGRGAYCGLPIGETWMTYFGSAYTGALQTRLALQPTAKGSLFEIPQAWHGSQRTGAHSLLGRVPDDFLQYTVDRMGVQGHTEIRNGVALAPAKAMPPGLMPTRGSYRAFAWSPIAVDRSRLQASLSRDGLTITAASNDHVLAERDGWKLRLRSRPLDAVPFGKRNLKGMYDGRLDVTPGYELAPSIDAYSEFWEVSGGPDPQTAHFNTWLGSLEALSVQHPNTVWFDVGPLH